jgi:hypothetical protein
MGGMAPAPAGPMGPGAGGFGGARGTAQKKTTRDDVIMIKDREFDVVMTVEFFEFRKKGEELVESSKADSPK